MAAGKDAGGAIRAESLSMSPELKPWEKQALCAATAGMFAWQTVWVYLVAQIPCWPSRRTHLPRA